MFVALQKKKEDEEEEDECEDSDEDAEVRLVGINTPSKGYKHQLISSFTFATGW